MLNFSEIDWFVAGISSGKDSSGLLLYLKNEFFPENDIPLSKLICTFSNTGNEAKEVYDHILLISQELHPVVWLEPELPFYDLVHKKKMFPYKQARFCTQYLKLEPAKQFMSTLGGSIVSVTGVRAEESKERSLYDEWGHSLETYHGRPEWRPLLRWTLEDVFLIHKKYGFPLNPLYAKGFTRVGCFPCVVFASKSEIRLIANQFPERIDLVREKENAMPNDAGFGQAFPIDKTPKRYRSKMIITKDGREIYVPTIDDVVAWSRTTDRKRSSNYDFHFEDFEDEPRCMAGVCE